LEGRITLKVVSYQVPQEKITEHIDLWRNFARGAEPGQDCTQGIQHSSPRTWPRVEELEVVTALPPHMDQGCVWVMRDTGWFYIRVRWGH